MTKFNQNKGSVVIFMQKLHISIPKKYESSYFDLNQVRDVLPGIPSE